MPNTVTIRVPATTANLGPGFDSLGVALNLYNTVTVSKKPSRLTDPFLKEAAALFYKTARLRPGPFSVAIAGDVPRSRGLGSSVTVRLGLLYGLNELHRRPLDPAALLDLVIRLEGHPDNAVPAFYGGFAACSGSSHFRCRVDKKLKFIAVVPSFELSTKAARSVLPSRITRAEAVANFQNIGLIVGAFASRRYTLLRGHMGDTLHQPYRAELIPGFHRAIAIAVKQGALGAYLSGAGSTLMALATSRQAESIGIAMANELILAGDDHVQVHVLEADNTGVKRIAA
jgi:homoserine kinase